MEQTPRPRPVQRDTAPIIAVPEHDGEERPQRSTMVPARVATAEAVDRDPADGTRGGDARSDALDRSSDRTEPGDAGDRAADRTEPGEAADRIRNGPVTIEKVQVHRPGLGKRERRGAMVAGALGLPLVTLGLITLAVPIGAWYLTTVFKTVIVAFTSLFDEGLARGLDAQITSVNPTAFGNIASWLVIVGAALLLGGLLLSWIVLRAHGVFHPVLVTLTAVPMALGLSFVLQAGTGALGGLFFQLGEGGVSAVVANAVFAAMLVVVLWVVIAVVAGILVWLWMASVFRATVVTGAPERQRPLMAPR